MKKLLSLMLALCLVLSLAACGSAEEDKKNAATSTPTPTTASTTEPTSTPESTPTPEACTPIDISVAVLKGPTAIGMVKLMSDNEAGTAKNNYSFTVAGAADEITAKLLSGEIQIASVPSNLAATLYNKSNGKVVVAAVNTLGVLSIVETGDSIQSIADLKGKTIYSTGAGTTPEYTLRYLLTSAGIDPDKDVTIEYLSEATEVAARLAATEGEDVIAMLPQPYVTTVMMQNESVRIALDITEEWEKLNDDSTVVTGCIAINKAFLDANEANVKGFLAEYAVSAEYATSNVEDAAALVEHFDIFKAAVAQKAIPFCNITYLEGTEMKLAVSSYLNVLFEQNAASIGGALPADDFYYSAN